MGDVAVRMRVMPESIEVDLAQIKEKIRGVIPPYTRLHAVEEMPVAFGLKALIVVAIMGDRAGGTEELESNIGKIPGVESVVVEEVGLL
ncbi:MAG: elongation factor 1-beta [Methanotrichaceae archaeon]|nr:elongation factor 1-beta [Methanotrichaceae archaeon]